MVLKSFPFMVSRPCCLGSVRTKEWEQPPDRKDLQSTSQPLAPDALETFPKKAQSAFLGYDIEVDTTLIRLHVIDGIPVPLNGALAARAAGFTKRAGNSDVEID